MNDITKALRCRVKEDARPSVTPMYLTSGFEAGSPYFYTRNSNPNIAELEAVVATLEGAAHGVAVTTGMTAISLVLELLEPGDTLCVGRDIYGCSYRLFDRISRKRRLRLEVTDLTAGDVAIPDGTRMVFFETPTNPFLKTVDIERVAAAARRRSPHALVVVDNTWATPLFQHPLEHGADISLHSATKFLAGHADVMCGLLLTNRADLADELRQARFYSGAILDPHSAWLLRRSVQTLPLRMREHERVTGRLQAFLARRPEVTRVCAPRVDGRQLTGYGGIVCFELRADLADRYAAFAGQLRLFDTGTAMACVTSKVAQPYSGSHASMNAEEKAAMGLGPGLVRLCLGFEDPADLEADLAGAFAALTGSLEGVARAEA
jgi:cystathionine gamma-lyase/cystathionine gamma-lyase/homocysteine desulfhydrase